MKAPYTYTILRYVHDTTTGEFINVGVALYAPSLNYVSANCRTTLGRVSRTFPEVNRESFKEMVRFIQSRFEEIGAKLNLVSGGPRYGSILEIAHSVLPSDDSSLQWSPAGSGLTDNPSVTLEQLYERMVMQHEGRQEKSQRNDDDVWKQYKKEFEAKQVLKSFAPVKIAVADDEVDFGHSWKNGIYHCLQPVSFDLAAGERIREKAHRWLGQMSSIQKAPQQFKVYILAGEPQKAELRDAYNSAIGILKKMPVSHEIVTDRDTKEFVDRFAAQIQQHDKQ